MDIGLGLPISNPARLGEWAHRAEDAGFSTLALLDRLAFHNPEPLVTLASLAGVTGRIALQTEVLLGPLRSTALLAKQVATGREGRPRIVCQANVALGGRDTLEEARAAVADYYAFTGRTGWGAPITDVGHLRDTVEGFRALGADEVVLYCYADRPDQIDRIAALDLT